MNTNVYRNSARTGQFPINHHAREEAEGSPGECGAVREESPNRQGGWVEVLKREHLARQTEWMK